MGLFECRDRLVGSRFAGTRLGYLIGQAGYFHEGHRAVNDCFALLEVLDQDVGSQSPTPFAELYEASQRSRVRIFAENSPFDLKDHLKARGYRWSDGSDGKDGDVDRLVQILGRPLHSCSETAKILAAAS